MLFWVLANFHSKACRVDGGHFVHLQVSAHAYTLDVLALFAASHRKRQPQQQAVVATVIVTVVGMVDFVQIQRNIVELRGLCEDGMPALREIG